MLIPAAQVQCYNKRGSRAMSLGNPLLTDDSAYRYLTPKGVLINSNNRSQSFAIDSSYKSRSSTGSSGESAIGKYVRSKTNVSFADDPNSDVYDRQTRLYSLPTTNMRDMGSTEEIIRRFRFTLAGAFKNIGDSRRRSTRKSSLISSHAGTISSSAGSKIEMEILEMENGIVKEFTVYHVVIIGSKGCGKRSLLRQFASSEYRGIYSFATTTATDYPAIVPVMIDDEEVRLQFFVIDLENIDVQIPVGDAYILVYDITKRRSFEAICQRLRSLHDIPVIVVANKIDLVRNRCVSKKEGITLSKNHKVRFIETSAALNDRIDYLLAGCVRQIQVDRTLIPESEQTKKKLSFLDTWLQCLPFCKQQFNPEHLL